MLSVTVIVSIVMVSLHFCNSLFWSRSTLEFVPRVFKFFFLSKILVNLSNDVVPNGPPLRLTIWPISMTIFIHQKYLRTSFKRFGLYKINFDVVCAFEFFLDRVGIPLDVINLNVVLKYYLIYLLIK